MKLRCENCEHAGTEVNDADEIWCSHNEDLTGRDDICSAYSNPGLDACVRAAEDALLGLGALREIGMWLTIPEGARGPAPQPIQPGDYVFRDGDPKDGKP